VIIRRRQVRDLNTVPFLTSEIKLEPELDFPWSVDLRVVDSAKGTAVQVLINAAQAMAIGNVEGSDPELKIAFLSAKVFQQCHIFA
jgi:hypothetical protein